MLADEYPNIASGRLYPDTHRPGDWLGGVIDFIYHILPCWRDDAGRPFKTAETHLTEQLCQFLNSVIRHTAFDSILFLVEIHDPVAVNRVLDLVPMPVACTLWIGGRRYTIYDPLLPIECKRLPTPADPRRDPREYLHTLQGRTGGVQRFRNGLHGAKSDMAAMIGFIQVGTATEWFDTVNEWVAELEGEGVDNWRNSESLMDFCSDGVSRSSRSTSAHPRDHSNPITLHHLWVEM